MSPFYKARYRAQYYNIEWDLTEKQYNEFWRRSGKERGSGKYRMIRKDRNKGFTIDNIVCKPYGVPPAPRKYTEELIRNIRNDIRSPYVIAKEYGFNHGYVYQIKQRKIWKSVV